MTETDQGLADTQSDQGGADRLAPFDPDQKFD